MEVEGEGAWTLAEHAPHLEAATVSRSVRLLPAFDQYVIGATSGRVDASPLGIGHLAYPLTVIPRL